MSPRFSLFGFILIIVGVLLILSNASIYHVDWNFLVSLWPLLLVLLGLKFIFGQSQPGIFVIISILVIIGAVLLSIPEIRSQIPVNRWEPARTQTQDLQSSLKSNTVNANLTLDTGAGTFAFGDTTDQLINVHAVSSLGSYKLDETTHDSTVDVHLSLDRSNWLNFGPHQNDVTIALNSTPVWGITTNLGAATADLDLSQYNVKQVTLNGGATSFNLKLNDKNDQTLVKISTGAAKGEIEIPQAVGSEIKIGTAVSSQNFTGFTKIDNKTYRTANFDQATKKILFDISGAASSYNVSQY